MEEVVARRETDNSGILRVCGAGYVGVGIEVFLADEALVVLHGGGGDVPVDMMGDVIGHFGEAEVRVVVQGVGGVHDFGMGGGMFEKMIARRLIKLGKALKLR
jgi:hypothetical protein